MQGYNAQIAVDSAHQIIVATDLSNHPKDEDLLKHMVKRLPEKPTVMTADAAYGTPENIKYLKKRHIGAYIAIKRQKHGHKLNPRRGDGFPITSRSKSAWRARSRQ
jgi:DNA integrity scanning protein DisA with diadenylate cyclase activity